MVIARIAQTPLIDRIAGGVRRAFVDDRPEQEIEPLPFSRPLRSVVGRGAPAGTQVVEVWRGEVAGAYLYVDLASERDYRLGTYETHVQAYLARNIAAGDVVYDIGAHVGFLSLLMARLVGPWGVVHAFEPLRENVDRLQLNVATNGVENVVPHALALCDHGGPATFDRRSSSFDGRLSERGGLVVETETIDNLVARGLPAPDVIKIDVGGGEAAVVRGARETIRAGAPRLLVEVTSAESGRAMLAELPVPYECRDARWGSPRLPLTPGHYELRPVVPVALLREARAA